MIIWYARVSTEDQNLDSQIDTLKTAGAEKVFKEKIERAYIPEIDGMGLVYGETTYSSGVIHKWESKYIPQLKSMRLVDGEVIFPSGTIQKVKRAYSEQRNEMVRV